MTVDPIVVAVGFSAAAMLVVLQRFKPKLIKLDPNQALVRTRSVSLPTGPKGVEVFFDKAYVLPTFDTWGIVDISIKTMEIVRAGREGIHCRDNLRADMGVNFQISIPKLKESVLRVASSLGFSRASDPQALERLFIAKFAGAMKHVTKQLDFEELYYKRDVFNDAVMEVIGQDLNGYTLVSVDLDHLEQTPIEMLDPDNILDAEGITKITDRTATQHVATNRLRRKAEKAVAVEDHEHAREMACNKAMNQADIRLKEAEIYALVEELRITAAERQDQAKLQQTEQQTLASH